jgi:hypothetical protein
MVDFRELDVNQVLSLIHINSLSELSAIVLTISFKFQFALLEILQIVVEKWRHKIVFNII